MADEVSHAEIYARLLTVEQKVDEIKADTKGVVEAFQAAQGAFLVLDFLGKFAKPIMYISGCLVAAGIWWQSVKDHLK